MNAYVHDICVSQHVFHSKASTVKSAHSMLQIIVVKYKHQ